MYNILTRKRSAVSQIGGDILFGLPGQDKAAGSSGGPGISDLWPESREEVMGTGTSTAG